jgi:LysM repeat protein
MTIYTVQPEDTLPAIAERFGTTVQVIAQANNIPDPDLILPGQVLAIPVTVNKVFVGEGIRRKMAEDGTTAVTAEMYEFGNRHEPQWSMAIGANGSVYRWIPAAAGAVYRYRPADGGGDGGSIQTRYGPAPVNLSAAIRKYFPTREWVNAAEISQLESTWRATAVADTRHQGGGKCNVQYRLHLADCRFVNALTEYSIGFFQINVCAHGGTYQTWIVPDTNVEKAVTLWKASGWRPWYFSALKLGLIDAVSPEGEMPFPHIPSWLYAGLAPSTLVQLMEASSAT